MQTCVRIHDALSGRDYRGKDARRLSSVSFGACMIHKDCELDHRCPHASKNMAGPWRGSKEADLSSIATWMRVDELEEKKDPSRAQDPQPLDLTLESRDP